MLGCGVGCTDDVIEDPRWLLLVHAVDLAEEAIAARERTMCQ